MTDVIIQGINGRMGRVLQELIAQRNDCRVVAGIDLAASNGDIPVFASFNDLTVKGDVLIDFSAPAATRNAIQYCREHKLPCVICKITPLLFIKPSTTFVLLFYPIPK